MRQRFGAHNVRGIIFVLFLLLLLTLSSCVQPVTIPTTVTPVPSLNLTPQNNAESTLLPLIATQTAVVGEMYQTLIPLNQTVVPLVMTSTAVAVSSQEPASSTGVTAFSVMGFMRLFFIWLFPVFVLSGYGFYTGFRLQPFVLFFSYPRYSILTLLDEEIDVDQVHSSGLKRLLIVLNRWAATTDSIFVLFMLSTLVVVLIAVLLTWPSMSFLADASIDLLFLWTAALIPLTFLIHFLLSIVGKGLGLAWYASRGNRFFHTYSEEFLTKVWMRILTSWSIGLTILLLVLLWPVSILLPRYIIGILVLVYFSLLWRQLARGVGSPGPWVVFRVLFVPLQWLGRRVRLFVQQAYLVREADDLPKINGGRLLVYGTSFLVFLVLSLSADGFWRQILRPALDSNEWLSLFLQRLQSYYLPFELESLAKHLPILRSVESSPMVPSWLMGIVGRPGVISAFVVLLFGWTLETLAWMVSSTVNGLNSGFRTFRPSSRALDLARHLAIGLFILLLLRSLLGSVVSITGPAFLLPVIDVLLVAWLSFKAGGWIFFGMRYVARKLHGQKVYLLPFAIVGGIVLGPILGHLKAVLLLASLLGNLPGLWLAAIPYLPQPLESFLKGVLDAQSVQLGFVLSLDGWPYFLLFVSLFLLALLYGAVGLYLSAGTDPENRRTDLFDRSVEVHFSLMGWTLFVWGVLSASLNVLASSQIGVINIHVWAGVLPFLSFAVFWVIYYVLLNVDSQVKLLGDGHVSFGSIWFWPFAYLLSERWQHRLTSLRVDVDYQQLGRFWKFLFLPHPYHIHKWSDIIPDTPFFRAFLSSFSIQSIQLPYPLNLRWKRFAGAGFAHGQAFVYFILDSLASIAVWPLLPGAASWLAGVSLVKNPLLVKTVSITSATFNVVIHQVVLLLACLFWSAAFFCLIQMFSSGRGLTPDRASTVVHRYFSNLVLASSICHLIFLPIHMAVTLFLRNGLSASQLQWVAFLISGMLNISTIFAFVFLSRTTLEKQLAPITHLVKQATPLNATKAAGLLNFLRSVWDSIHPLMQPSASKQGSFRLKVIWIGLGAQLVSFGLGWVSWRVLPSPAETASGVGFMDFAGVWALRLTGLGLSTLLMAVVSLPLVYNLFYRAFSWSYGLLAYPVSFFEPSTGQLPALPRRFLGLFHGALNPRHLIYPGYRHVLQNTLLAVCFSNGVIALILRPLEAGQPAATLMGQWGMLEIILTMVLAGLLSANLTRSIPVVTMLGGFLAAFVLTRYVPYLRIVAMVGTAVFLYGMFIATTPNSFDTLVTGARNNWYAILARFKTIQDKWFVLETFFRLDDGLFARGGTNFENDLIHLLGEMSNSQMYVQIKSSVYEEDPLVQALRTYFKYSPDSANTFVNSLLLTSQLSHALEEIQPEIRRWLFEAAIRVRFMEMQKTSENYLATLMQLRAARLLNEVGDTFGDPPVWQPLPLPVDLMGVSVLDEDRRAGELVLPKTILRVIRVYTSSSIDPDAVMEAWDAVQPSLIAEEVIRAFKSLKILLHVRSLTEIAALTFSEQQAFISNYDYMRDLDAPVTALADVAETIARAEELVMQDKPQFYVSALQQLQRLQSLIDLEVKNPERQLLGQCVFLWNTMLTEALSATIIPQSRVEIEIEQLEREWEEEEVIVLVVTNRAQGTAYNLHVNVEPGTGYEVLDPHDGVHIETLPGQGDARVEFRLQIVMREDIWVNVRITYDDAGQPNHVLEDKKLVQFIKEKSDISQTLSSMDFDAIRNPYHYGLPITDPGLFFGRNDIMSKIRQIITSATQTNVVMLYGQRRMGKSTILRQLLQQTKNQDEFWPVFIDIEMFTLPGTSGFLWELAHEIWRVLPQGHDLPEPKLDEFQISPGTYLIKEWMPQVDKAISAHGCSLLLLLDEFDLIYQNPRYSNQELGEILGIIRGLGHERQKGGIIYVGTYRLLEMTSLYQTPLFNQAVPIRVSFLDDNATQLLIRQPARGLLLYDANAVSKIMRLTGNHPYYLQLICSSIFERAMNFKTLTVNVSRVIDALEQAQQQGGLILDYLWKENTPLQKYVIGALARLNEHETSRSSISRVQRELGAYLIDVSTDEVQKSIEALSQWEIIVNENGQYRFTVDLFRLWLREHKTLASIRAEVGPISRTTR